jgi:hypothetical protein
MAVAAKVTLVWNALVAVLLKVIAGLGFAVPARAAGNAVPGATRNAVQKKSIARNVARNAAGGAAAAPVLPGARRAGRGVTRAAVRIAAARTAGTADRAAGTARAPIGGTPPTAAVRHAVPAPRAPHPLVPARDRSLPPTMKQRIRAEAHGSSPTARTLSGAAALPLPERPASGGAAEAAEARTEKAMASRAGARGRGGRGAWALCA